MKKQKCSSNYLPEPPKAQHRLLKTVSFYYHENFVNNLKKKKKGLRMSQIASRLDFIMSSH